VIEDVLGAALLQGKCCNFSWGLWSKLVPQGLRYVDKSIALKLKREESACARNLSEINQEMQLLLPYAQFTKDVNCWKMQSNSAQANARMSRCCTAFITPFRNILTCKLLNKTLSTLCKYWCRNGKELVDQVLQGHH